ncbi:MAG TPA: metallophosphoesterase [Pyrinomonadaceae bacterium]|jgi:tetratricopeptide (TPR) repeat protein|nr:metallophosphoesterase [Pyrinomonadaceae bacterium]
MPKLFVIMPFGIRPAMPDHSIETIDFDHIYQNLIRLAGEAAGWDVFRIDETNESGIITHQYLTEILEADVVLADISIPNENVFYELGIRQAISNGGTLLIAVEGSRIPFDISSQRVFYYSLDESGLERAKNQLINILSNPAVSFSENPIRLFLENVGIAVTPKADPVEFEKELEGRIERAQNLDQLIAIWKWAQKLAPLPPFRLLTLAKRLSEFNRWDLSVEVLRTATALRPTDFELQRELGWHLSKLDFEYQTEALECYKRALDLNPDDPETLGMMGGLYKRQMKYEEASECYSKGAIISPNNSYMLVNQAAMSILREPESPEVGVSIYKALIELIESNDDTKFNEWDEILLGESFFALGDIESAKKHYIAAGKIATSPKSLRSGADQLEIFGKAGFRTPLAVELANLLRSEADQLIRRVEIKEFDLSTEVTPGANNLPLLVHLSDLHFGWRGEQYMHRFVRDQYSRSLTEHIIDEFSSRRAHFMQEHDRLHFIVSGDLTYQGEKKEFELVEEFLNEVCRALNVNKEKVFIVPGNHDIHWGSDRVDTSQRFDNYIGFLISFYGKDIFKKRYPKIEGELAFYKERPAPKDLISFYHDLNSKITIVGFNSCIYENAQHHYGFIGLRQLEAAEELLEDHEATKDVVRLAFFHHHLHPFPEPIVRTDDLEMWTDLSTIRDAGFVERKLEELGFDIVLHGHKHKPQVRETSVKDLRASTLESSRLIVCGAGSVGVCADELEHNMSNHYEVIEILRSPRKRGTDFLNIEWRELALNPGAKWSTTGSWRIVG